MKKNRKKLEHLTLAEGEVTGHAHRATTGVLYEEDGQLVLKPKPGKTTIQHEEHTETPPLTETEYRVGRVQEYDHAAEEAKPVQD